MTISSKKFHAIALTGRADQITRTVSVSYTMDKDRSLLSFAIASKSPINITDNTTIGSDIYSDWSHPSLSPPITLANISTINGDINTILNESDFTSYDFPDKLLGTYEDLNYNQPEIDFPTADDFDTSMYFKDTSTLPAGHTYNRKEYFPHTPSDYTQPLNTESVELNRTVYENLVIDDKRCISGNALFKNCTFSGIFYVGNSSGIGTNNVRFDNCTFNGPIITGVPPQFGPEDWKKNALYFTGDTVFNNNVMEEVTILAPNYNVDIGNTTSVSTINGVVLGGVVDIRGNANVDGTVVSMADPLQLSDSTLLLDTSIGISDQGTHTINISPSPDRMMPMGISTKIIMSRNGSSYVEW